jgi:hypothetical protein
LHELRDNTLEFLKLAITNLQFANTLDLVHSGRHQTFMPPSTTISTPVT